jgi:leucyl/phenylalanyl-tRNA--protein transferase
MAGIQRIRPESLDFPATEQALSYPNGLLAVGGDLSVERLMGAYRRGIFPWYEDPQPIMWWSPDPRSVLFPDELRVSRSLRRSLRNRGYRVSADRAFHKVVMACAGPRAAQRGTWITNRMARAYIELHSYGYAHSIEVRDRSGELVGGLYGVALPPVFFGESMFSLADDASKVALVALVHRLREKGYSAIDCQVESEHLNSLGARNIPRREFELHLEHERDPGTEHRRWEMDMDAGDLL